MVAHIIKINCSCTSKSSPLLPIFSIRPGMIPHWAINQTFISYSTKDPFYSSFLLTIKICRLYPILDRSCGHIQAVKLLQISAHAMAAQLPWHVQNIAAITSLHFIGWEHDNLSVRFEFWVILRWALVKLLYHDNPPSSDQHQNICVFCWELPTQYVGFENHQLHYML